MHTCTQSHSRDILSWFKQNIKKMMMRTLQVKEIEKKTLSKNILNSFLHLCVHKLGECTGKMF